MNEKDVANYTLKKSDGMKGHLTFPGKKNVEEEDEEYEKGIKRMRKRIINKIVFYLPSCEYM